MLRVPACAWIESSVPETCARAGVSLSRAARVDARVVPADVVVADRLCLLDGGARAALCLSPLQHSRVARCSNESN
jgi:hypothetical protein